MYSLTYILVSLTPFPSVYIAYQDQDYVKTILFNQYHILYSNFFKSEVFAAIFDSNNPGAQFTIGLITFGVVYLISLFVFSCYNIHKILKNNNSKMSKSTRNHHIAVLKALAAGVDFLILNLVDFQICCFTFLFIATCIPMLILIYTQSWRTDIWNICVFNGILCVPTIFTTFVFSYKPYRIFFHKISKGMVTRVTEINTIG